MGQGTDTTDQPAVAVFFYGSYMNRSVLSEAGLTPHSWEVATLAGFDIDIRPRANLVRAPGSAVWGILASATHADLERLYSHARDVLGEVYLPRAVLVETSGGYQPALCYICPRMQQRPAARDYIDRILAPAREHGFPADYLTRIERYRHRGDLG
jgi:Gamma-glutamyl cyclotransferase, AIG2-like